MTTNELIEAIEAIYGIDLSEYTAQSELIDEFGTIVTLTGIECFSQHFEDAIPHKNPGQGSVEIFLEDGLPTMVHRQWTEFRVSDWIRTDEVSLETTSPGGGYTHTLIFRKKNHAVFSGF